MQPFTYTKNKITNRPTMKDIARGLAVSVSTVSHTVHD